MMDPHTPPAAPPDADQEMTALLKAMIDMGKDNGLQIIVALGRPDRDGLDVAAARHCNPALAASLVRRLSEDPEIARSLDAQRMASILDGIDATPPADPADAGEDGKTKGAGHG